MQPGLLEGCAVVEQLEPECPGPQQTRLSLEVTGLLPRFATNVFSAHDEGAWKPDPRLLIRAANALGVPPWNCAVVEDAAPGIEAGIAAGMTVFALCLEDRWNHDRVHVVSGLSDLGALLGHAGQR